MSDTEDTVDAALRRSGLPARLADRPAIIAELREQIRLEAEEDGDQLLMRLLCAQLFSLGVVDDALLIWVAKSCNVDTYLGIDAEFLCGAGLEPTKVFLTSTDTDAARAALTYISDSEAEGKFKSYSVDGVLRYAKIFYEVP